MRIWKHWTAISALECRLSGLQVKRLRTTSKVKVLSPTSNTVGKHGWRVLRHQYLKALTTGIGWWWCNIENQKRFIIWTVKSQPGNVVDFGFNRSQKVDNVNSPQLPPHKYQRSTNSQCSLWYDHYPILVWIPYQIGYYMYLLIYCHFNFIILEYIQR